MFREVNQGFISDSEKFRCLLDISLEMWSQWQWISKSDKLSSEVMHKGHLDKVKGGRDWAWQVGMAGVGGSETAVLKQQYKTEQNKK